MAQRLRDAKLLDYRKYYGVRLTARGEEIALRVLRRHRLIELFLVQRLGYAMYEVHDEAESLEHAVSDRFIEALAAIMGQPQLDPHGDPIPSVDGRIQAWELQRLCDLPPAQPATIRGLSSTDAVELDQQKGLGFKLGAQVVIENEIEKDGAAFRACKWRADLHLPRERRHHPRRGQLNAQVPPIGSTCSSRENPESNFRLGRSKSIQHLANRGNQIGRGYWMAPTRC